LTNLLNSLQEEAYRLQSPNDTNNSLWTASWQAGYKMKRIIAEQHIGELFKIKPISDTSSAELRELLDNVTKNV
jgi:hypothetical protein